MWVLLWVGACISDLTLLAATVVVASHSSDAVGWLIIGFAWRAWWATGNFENWRPTLVRQYFARARRIDGRH